MPNKRSRKLSNKPSSRKRCSSPKGRPFRGFKKVEGAPEIYPNLFQMVPADEPRKPFDCQLCSMPLPSKMYCLFTQCEIPVNSKIAGPATKSRELSPLDKEATVEKAEQVGAEFQTGVISGTSHKEDEKYLLGFSESEIDEAYIVRNKYLFTVYEYVTDRTKTSSVVEYEYSEDDDDVIIID